MSIVNDEGNKEAPLAPKGVFKNLFLTCSGLFFIWLFTVATLIFGFDLEIKNTYWVIFGPILAFFTGNYMISLVNKE
jgi:hypothetical protein